MNKNFTAVLLRSLQAFAASSLPLLLDPRAIGRMAENAGPLPTFEMKVMRRGIFWRTVAAYRGWSVERNVITQHHRLVDPNNYRRSWGGSKAMLGLLQQVIKASARK